MCENGFLDGVDVIINAGDAMTAFSGGEYWKNKKLATTLRKWIYEGGGFVGVGEPSACEHGSRYFQLADVLGVDKELGFSLSTDKYYNTAVDTHFILEDKIKDMDFGESMNNIYSLYGETEIIEYSNNEVHLATHNYGNGRGVYIAGLPYSQENTRLLMRSLYYAANKEKEMKKWYTDNIYCEVNAYPETGKYAILNNSNRQQVTNFYDGGVSANRSPSNHAKSFGGKLFIFQCFSESSFME